MKNFFDRIREFRGKPVYEILAKTKESKGSFFVCYREYIFAPQRVRAKMFSLSKLKGRSNMTTEEIKKEISSWEKWGYNFKTNETYNLQGRENYNYVDNK